MADIAKSSPKVAELAKEPPAQDLAVPPRVPVPAKTGVDRMQYAARDLTDIQRNLLNVRNRLGKLGENPAAALLLSENTSLAATVNTLVKTFQNAVHTGSTPQQSVLDKAVVVRGSVQKYLDRVEKFKA